MCPARKLSKSEICSLIQHRPNPPLQTRDQPCRHQGQGVVVSRQAVQRKRVECRQETRTGNTQVEYRRTGRKMFRRRGPKTAGLQELQGPISWRQTARNDYGGILVPRLPNFRKSNISLSSMTKSLYGEVRRSITEV